MHESTIHKIRTIRCHVQHTHTQNSKLKYVCMDKQSSNAKQRFAPSCLRYGNDESRDRVEPELHDCLGAAVYICLTVWVTKTGFRMWVVYVVVHGAEAGVDDG